MTDLIHPGKRWQVEGEGITRLMGKKKDSPSSPKTWGLYAHAETADSGQADGSTAFCLSCFT